MKRIHKLLVFLTVILLPAIPLSAGAGFPTFDLTGYLQEILGYTQDGQQIANEIAATKKQIHARQSKRERILRSLEELRRCGDILEDFDEEIWNAMVESVTVDKDKTITLTRSDKDPLIYTYEE